MLTFQSFLSSVVVEVKSLRGNFGSLRKCMSSADFVLPNWDEVVLRSLREAIRSDLLYLSLLL